MRFSSSSRVPIMSVFDDIFGYSHFSKMIPWLESRNRPSFLLPNPASSAYSLSRFFVFPLLPLTSSAHTYSMTARNREEVAGRLRPASPRVVADNFHFLPLGAVRSLSTEICCLFHESDQREVPRCGNGEKDPRVSLARPNI